MKIQLFIIVTLAAMLAANEFGYVQVCGRNLAQLLDNLCDEPKRNDKREPIVPYESSWPWVRSSHAKALGGSRGKRLVASECCMKPCSIGELLSYC